jgi:hypothetical protein
MIGSAAGRGGTLALSTAITCTVVESAGLEPQPLTTANTIAAVTRATTASVPRPNPDSVGTARCRLVELEGVGGVDGVGRNLAK